MTPGSDNNKDVTIAFTCGEIKSYWELTERNSNQGIEFFTFSDLVSPTSASYDVLTFYVSFILIIGRFVRTFVSGEAEKVIYTEMPRPHKLVHLCEGIKISRYKQDLEREDKLYYVLIDLMRSPEILKMITKSSLQFTHSTVSSKNQIASSEGEDLSKRNKRRNKIIFY